MKKLFISLFLISAVTCAILAQPAQGSLSVGGNFNFQLNNTKQSNNNNSTDGPKDFYFNVTPSAEYYVLQNISAGASIGYDFHKQYDDPNNPDNIDKTSIFSIIPFLRMYYSLGDKVNVFGQGSLGLGFGKHTIETTVGNTTVSNSRNIFNFNIGLQPGIQYLISNKLALEATFGFLGFNSNSQKSGGNKTTNSYIQANLSPASIGFGIRYFIK